ncbi:MAG: histidine--tRNA ligase, partial [Oscillospiraceae bacterium]|nr:histidine--tRNA ligase [Oscillospiraceae bacterium]
MTDYPEIGSICSGGRYDDLAGYYTDKMLPGVGISIGLTRLFYVLSEQGLISDEMITAPCDALVLPMTDDLSFAISSASVLRNAGIRTQLYTEQKKFKSKMNYADRLSVPFAVIVGEDEVRDGVLSVKNMKSGEQVKLSPEAAARHIAAAVTELGKSTVIKEK